MHQVPPTELIAARVEAFRRGDFGFIFDSYHPDSFFREQFPERSAYLAFAAEHLAGRIRIECCRILREELGASVARVIFYQRIQVAGEVQETFELARLYREQGRWFYHSSQKLSREEFAGAPEQLDFIHFDAVADKVWF